MSGRCCASAAVGRVPASNPASAKPRNPGPARARARVVRGAHVVVIRGGAVRHDARAHQAHGTLSAASATAGDGAATLAASSASASSSEAEVEAEGEEEEEASVASSPSSSLVFDGVFARGGAVSTVPTDVPFSDDAACVWFVPNFLGGG